MVILVILYNRPEYTIKCLEHLAKVDGIQTQKILFQIDCCNQNVIDQAQAWNKSSIMINDKHLGCNGNTYAGLERAFNEDDTVAVVEDDVLVSTDWLNFVNKPEFKDSFAICPFRKHINKPVMELERYSKIDRFCSWGCVLYRRSWEKIKSIWTDEAWSRRINNSGVVDKGSIIQPAIGRSINIGSSGGTNIKDHRAWVTYCHTPYWYENIK